jgi:hypothetical protein
MISLLALSFAAAANPVAGGVQVAFFGPALDLASAVAETQDLTIEEAELSGEYSCYDKVGVRDFNINIPVDTADFTLKNGSLEVELRFETIRGEDMVLFGEDDDWADACASFETDIAYVQIDDAHVVLELRPILSEAGELEMEVVGQPTIEGDLDTDISWVPDDVVLYFLEDTIFETASEKIAEAVPELVAGLIEGSLYAGSFGDFDVQVDLSDVDVDEDALQIGVDPSFTWTGEGCARTDAPTQASGRDIEVDFGAGDGSAFALGLPELMVNRILLSAYADGLLCLDEGTLGDLVETLEAQLAGVVDNISVAAELNALPTATLDTDGIRLDFPSLSVSVDGDYQGQNTTVLGLTADLSAVAELAVSPALGSITLTLHELTMANMVIDADHLLSDEEGAADRMAGVIERMVGDVLAAQVSQMALFDSTHQAYGFYLRLDDVDHQTGGLALRASLFAEGDPEIDLIEPETHAGLTVSSADASALASWWGEDDRDGELAYAWRLDGGSWSSWTLEESAALEGLDAGWHSLEVKARDSWLNEDSSPAAVDFEVPVLTPAEDETKGCRCSTSTAPLTGAPWALILLFACARRRNEQPKENVSMLADPTVVDGITPGARAVDA